MHGLSGDEHNKRLAEFDLNIFLESYKVPRAVVLYSDGVQTTRNAGADAIVSYSLPDGAPPDGAWPKVEGLVVRYLKRGKSVAVSCHGGHGRTGTLIAGLLALHHADRMKVGFDPILLAREVICKKEVETVRQVDWVYKLMGRPVMELADLNLKYFNRPLVLSSGTSVGASDEVYDTFDAVEKAEVEWTGPSDNRRPYTIIFDEATQQDVIVRLYWHPPIKKFITLRDCRTLDCKGLYADVPAQEANDAHVNICLRCGSEEEIKGERLASSMAFWGMLVSDGVLVRTDAVDESGKIVSFFALADWDGVVPEADAPPVEDVPGGELDLTPEEQATWDAFLASRRPDDDHTPEERFICGDVCDPCFRMATSANALTTQEIIEVILESRLQAEESKKAIIGIFETEVAPTVIPDLAAMKVVEDPATTIAEDLDTIDAILTEDNAETIAMKESVEETASVQ